MDRNEDVTYHTFSAYLQSAVNLDDLDKNIHKINSTIEFNRNMMKEIKQMYVTVPKTNLTLDCDTSITASRHEELSKFLDASPPNLLLTDMVGEVDIEQTIHILKIYVERFRAHHTSPVIPNNINIVRNFDGFLSNLDQCTLNLELLKKRASKVLSVKRGQQNSQRNEELEEKLTVLCQNVQYISMLVSAITKLSISKDYCNNNNDVEHGPLRYDQLVCELLGAINEVTFMLTNEK